MWGLGGPNLGPCRASSGPNFAGGALSQFDSGPPGPDFGFPSTWVFLGFPVA